jgi:non-ribosomal peptide synthase protein (TIGR01720 family)
VPLSPIQYWFFKGHENAPQYWNQGVRLDNLPTSSEQQVGEVCEYIITQHDALRAQFRNIENKWVQEFTGPEQICALEYVDLSIIETAQHEQTVLEHTQRVQDQFDLSKGSLFKCIYFTNHTTSSDFCILLAHHLVVDAVSWQIIIDDFGTALHEVVANNSITKDAKTNSFKDWTEYLTTYAEDVSKEEFAFWQSQITKVPSLPFDKENISVIEEQDITQLHFSFDALTTKALVTANQAFNTRTEELLIAAFINIIGNWSNHKEITVGFERHGRASNGTTLDVSKTVGWFTSYFPLKFAHQSDNSIDNQIIASKEKMRSLPSGGIGYGGLRYIKNAFGAIDNPEIVFNFLGTQTRSQSKNAIKSTTLTAGLRDPQSERHYKLEVNIGIIDSVLSGSFSFGKKVHETKTMDLLLHNFKSQIQVISDHCNQTQTSRYTPSDFSDAEISQDDLDSLMDLLT